VTNLSVNVNKIALIRNARGGSLPDIKEISNICIDSGCHGITVHPRDDMRHIIPNDIKILKELTESRKVEFNIEGNPFSEKKGEYPGFLNLVESFKPTQCTLVPDKPTQLTSDHGWDLREHNSELIKVIQKIKSCGCRVSLFIDPDQELISIAKDIGADRIELYTGPYAKHIKNIELLGRYSVAEKHAHNIGLKVNAGHDLNLSNLGLFLANCEIEEVSIGHALISDAVKCGLGKTVKKYLQICN
tara:strand:- start:8843 stop:9577 length:735 start_codon:yes stop_codon:yes gene_type:complete